MPQQFMAMLYCRPDNDRGQQCCYGNNGVLVQNEPGGGSADASSPLSNYYSHALEDLLPYILCCKNNDTPKCDMYFSKRSSDDGSSYRFPRPG